MYVAMLMTDWAIVHNPSDSLDVVQYGSAAFWVKSGSALVCYAIYIWTLVAPIVFPDRDWGNSQ